MLRIAEAQMQRICRQAIEEYPGECCGILTAGTEGGEIEVHPCRNIQDELHERDPTQYPRNSRIAYFIDPGELFSIVNGADRAGGRIAGFYHSHIDCDAYFSEEDKARAMAWDEPAYPDAVYLVVSVYGGEVRGHRAFSWDPRHSDFQEAEIQVLA